MNLISSHVLTGLMVAVLLVAGCAAPSPSPSPSPPDLPGTEWTLLRLEDGTGTLVGVLNGTEITAVFMEDGQISGSAGCNNYFASYTIDGQTLRIGIPGATLMACAEPNGIMEQERMYLSLLETVAGYDFTDDMLSLVDSGGEAILEFSAAS